MNWRPSADSAAARCGAMVVLILVPSAGIRGYDVSSDSAAARRGTIVVLILVPSAGIRGYGAPWDFHLMLQPTLGFWSGDTGLPASTASSAARRSLPVT